MEAGELGLFMVSAGGFGTLLFYPGSLVVGAVADPFVRLVLMGLAMGLTALALFLSPWGQRSGAHLNPAVTLTFFRLGKVRGWDAVFYPIFQVLGGTLGVLLVRVVLGELFTESPVRYVVTVPGEAGEGWAFFAEILIAFGMMTMVLHTSNHPRWARFTPVFAACLVAVFVVTTGPVSGFSLNPARTLASALPSGVYTAFWIYLVAPPLGMGLAAETYLLFHRKKDVKCAKLHHHNDEPCPFNCGYCEHEAAVDEHPV